MLFRSGERRHLLSQEIDIDYEDERLALQQSMIEAETSFREDISFINEDSEEMPTTNSSRSSNEAINNRREKPIMVDKEIQIKLKNTTEPIRLVRNSTYKILNTIASVSTTAGILVEKAQKATREVCMRKYGDEDNLKISTGNAESEPPRKVPRTAEDYKKYEKVLPSNKAVSNFKHKKAIRQEIIAAKALYSKKETTKASDN